MSDIGLFEAIDSMRSMRRLDSRPVPPEMLRRVLDAGTRAPSGQNTQPWAFLVVQDDEAKRFVQVRYHAAMRHRFGAFVDAIPAEDRSLGVRNVRAAMHLSEHLHEAPVLLFVCGLRDWPAIVPEEERRGKKAPPSYGSIYPCVQNILLACRGLGLGASLTTAHMFYEDDLHERFAIAPEYGVVAMIPIGFPTGNFGPVSRSPVEELTHFDRWGALSGF